MRLSDFDYALPDALIAHHPPAERTASRLLQVTPDGAMTDLHFRDLGGLLRPGDLLVMNDTRVIKARLLGSKEDSGGRIEVMIERLTGEHTALAQIRASKPPKPGTALRLGSARAVVQARDEQFYRLQFDEPLAQVLERDGRLPLPPYISRDPQGLDDSRYQTVYARAAGAVAAPTAGLHFDDALLAELRASGIDTAFVTLHVGAGTFQPVRHEDLSEHRMHTESYEIGEPTVQAIARARAAGGRVIAVGTTSMRALESRADPDGQLAAGQGDTALFITPGYRFRVVDALITNFHLPRSTLLMLVSAFAGVELIRAVYERAIREQYRFFSYGDAMFLSRSPTPTRVG